MHRHEDIGPGARIGAIIMVAGLFAAGGAWANNLTLTNLVLKPLDDTRAYAQFNIRWENSWRHTNINHDAAWVFFKVKPEGREDWEHVTVETNGHVAGTGTAVEIVVPSDRVGCFIRRAGEGSGTLSVTNVKVAWNFASNNLAKTDRVRIQALAMEMVYVAEGSFWVGDGTAVSIRGQFEAGTNGTPFQVTNEAYEIILGGGGTGSLGNNNASGMYSADDFNDTTIKTNPAAFPKGYAAFYCMKYEITQGQYRDFLNSLTRVQQITRTTYQTAGFFSMGGGATIYVYRNGIRCPSFIPLVPSPIVFGCDGNANAIMNETNDAMDRACNLLSWADGCAFADWAGLRPFTELEYEKACRGPLTPVANEYAWGDAIISATTTLLNDGTGMERATNGNCNYVDTSPDGPFRVGLYATTNSSRQSAGASYWGIMELSGNLNERTVIIGHATGRSFTGVPGDGQLNANGNATVATWPGYVSGEVTGAAGSGFRGASYMAPSAAARLSDRYYAHYEHAGRYFDDQKHSGGWRGARTAPAEVGP